MASVKISNLPQITEWTLPSVLPIVDSGSTVTSKIDLTSLFRASGSTISGTIGQNNIILGSSNSQIYDTATGSGTGDNGIFASTSVSIDKDQGGRAAIIASNEVRITNDVGEGAMNAIIASYNSDTRVDGGFANTIISTKGNTYIERGENNTAISAQGGNISYGGQQVLLGTNYFSMNSSYNSVAMASESGTISNHRYTIVGAHYQYNENDGGNQCVMLAGENNTFSSQGGFKSWKSGISVKESTIQDEGASLIATSGRTSLYDWTLHTDNLYSYERIQSNTNITTTVANVQTLTGGLGMVQYSDVTAGNLNLQIDDVRNGEVYHWVIDNQTGGSISVNSTATNTGFTITDNTANQLSTGAHIFTIVIVNNKIIIEGTH